jgi:4-amino-4-deoxy-L-arabinose transferase-like glycosyltransferase
VDHSDSAADIILPVGAPLTETRLTAVQSRSRWSWLVLALIAAVYVGTCFAPVIFDDNEGLYAGAVREMHASGNWLMPLSNGFPRVQKPPLVYWTMLVSTSVLGGSEFALRLPNALATVGWIVATYLIMRRLGGERLGVASALVLASMLGVWIFNHLIQPEPFLACFISLSMWCLVEARSRDRAIAVEQGWYVRFWIFLALGAMAKGLHGALWPLGTVLLTAFVAPGWRPWLRPVASLRGIVVFFAMLAPWYVYMTATLPHFLAAHFVNEQLGATLNTRFPADAKQLPLAQFYLQHLIFWMPWTLLLPAAASFAVKAARLNQLDVGAVPEFRRDVVRLLACWFGLVQVSVAFSTRQDYYSMSCWGTMAALFAAPWVHPEYFRRRARWFLVAPSAVVMLAGLAALGLVAWLAPRLGGIGAGSAAPIAQRDTFMDAIDGISPALWAHFIPLLGIFGAAMLASGLAATWLSWRERTYPALAVLAGAMAVPICLATAGFSMMSPYFSLAESARFINTRLASEPDAVVACEALPHTASSLFYYLDARVHWVNAPFAQDYPQSVLGLGRDYYLDESRLLDAWNGSTPVYFIVDRERLVYWNQVLPAGAKVEEVSGTRAVLSNR